MKPNVLVSLILTIILSVSGNPPNQRKYQRFNESQTDSNPGGSLPPLPLFPIPNGPFYGMPFNLSSTMTMPLPFTISGNCEAGTVYTVKTGSNLIQNYKTELECIFNAGLLPQKVPEGTFNGSILSILNTQAFNPQINQYWRGQKITKVPCNNQDTYIGWNKAGQVPFAPFIATLGPLELNLAPGEYNDGKESLITDYTQDFRKVCPNYRSHFRMITEEESQDTRDSNSPAVNNVYPLNQNIDALRFVGKQEDGGSIYLGKSYLRDAYRADLQAVTVAYYYIVSDDQSGSPSFFQAGQSLPPLEKSFKYILPGTVDFILRLLPVDNFLTAPVRTIDQFVRGIWKAGMNSMAYAEERRRGFRTGGNNRRRYPAQPNSWRTTKAT